MVKKLRQEFILHLYFILYLPILVLIVLSFNNSKSRVVWGGFTLNGTQNVLKTRRSQMLL